METLFVALDLPGSVKETLAALNGDIPGVNWVQPEMFHLTLAYLGSTSVDIDDLIDSFSALRAKAVEIALLGVALYPAKGSPRAIAVSVTHSETLINLHRKTNRAAIECGLTQPRKRYSPHVTLGRFNPSVIMSNNNQPMIDFLTRHALFEIEQFAIDSFFLYSSIRTRHGHHYQPRAEFLLK